MSAPAEGDFVAALRAQLVAAATRERARRLPRPGPVAPSTIVGAVAAVVLVGLVALAATTGLRPGAEPTPATPAIEGQALFGGSLDAGVRYRTRVFVPALSFVAGDDEWFMRRAADLDRLLLERRDEQPHQFLAFRRVVEVYDPAVRERLDSRRPGPADLHAWLRNHPDLRVGPVDDVTIAGRRGEAFDVDVRFTRPVHRDPRCDGAVCAAIAPGDSYPDGTRIRTIVLPMEPEPLVINQIGRSADDLEEVVRAAAPMLESLRIGAR